MTNLLCDRMHARLAVIGLQKAFMTEASGRNGIRLVSPDQPDDLVL